MASAKEIKVKVIPSKIANAFIKRWHYSGKVVQNSQLHFGAFLNDTLHGVMSFGPSLDKRKILGLVEGTKWNEFLELNRLAFDNILPRNSESRCISIAIRLLKKNAPHIKWIVSFADGTQCGDGTIYRASGFILTGIKKNNQIWEAPSGRIFQSLGARGVSNCNLEKAAALKEVYDFRSRTTKTKTNHILETGASSMKIYKEAGWKPKDGFQLRYIYLIDRSCKLNVPIIPFSEIEKRGAKMYLGKRPASIDSDAAVYQIDKGGASPTAGLKVSESVNA